VGTVTCAYARVHADTATRGQGIHRFKLEARRLRGSVDQRCNEGRAWLSEPATVSLCSKPLTTITSLPKPTSVSIQRHDEADSVQGEQAVEEIVSHGMPPIHQDERERQDDSTAGQRSPDNLTHNRRLAPEG
jgi:hypothetical protein